MKSSKNIPITKEFDKQQMIDAICAEMTPIEESNYWVKEQQVIVETKGTATIIRLQALNQNVNKKAKRKNKNQISEEQKFYFQSVKLIFSERSCKVTLEWPWGTAINDERMKKIVLIIALILFVLLWIPMVNAIAILIAIVFVVFYLVMMNAIDKKAFKEFETDIYELIESFL
ncbi:MAG: hypothetical protein IJ455_02325 [Agathobacter sp.]|nr:hypothetical protein [Agathobacter sp.]